LIVRIYFTALLLVLLLGQTFNFWFREIAYGGSFGAGPNPQVSYPVTIQGSSANLYTANIYAPPPATDVFITGPASSGLISVPAIESDSIFDEFEADYAFPTTPSVLPGGVWNISFNGTNPHFIVPDPEATARLVLPLPTVTITNGNLFSISWVYKDTTTGTTLVGIPAHIRDIQIKSLDF